MQQGGILAAVQSWLPRELEGADEVRRQVALRLAQALDAPDVQAYALARAASALAGVIEAIEPDEDVSPERLDRKVVKSLLAEIA